MTDDDKSNNPQDHQEEKDPKDMTDEEVNEWREAKMKKRIEELRRRDPFIYR